MRKKFTMLLTSLFLCMGAWAQEVYVTNLNDLSNDKVYFIESARCFLLNSANVEALATSNGSSVADDEKTKDWSNENQQFKIEKDGDSYYLYSVGAGKYVTKNDGAWSDTKDDALTLENVGGDYPWKLCIGGNGLNSQDPNQTASGIMVNSWTSTDAGNCYKILDIEASIVYDITYLFKYAGGTIGTQTATVGKGAAYPSVDATKYPYGFSATAPTGTVTANETVEIVLSPAFSWADSYENITAWYYLDLKDGKYLYYEEGQENIPLNKTAIDSNNKDAYSWGFVGDPINGFQIVNRAAGNSMILSSTTNTTDGNTGGNTYPVMTAMPVPEGNNTHWVFTASNYRENGFFIGQKDTNNGMNRLNNRNNKLAYWNVGADLGSTFVMVERPMTEAAELAALIEEIEAAGFVSGTNPGEYTEASVNALNEALETAKAVLFGTADDVTALQTAYDALEVNPINAGKYFIVNAKPDFADSKVLTTYGVCGWYGTANTPAWTEKNTNDPLQYFEIEVSGETYSLKSAYEGSYVTSINTLGDEPADVTFTWKGPGQYNITINGGVFHANLHGYGVNSSNIVDWDGEADSPSAWKLVAVTEEPTFTHTLTVGDDGWSTIVLGYNATIPTAEGFKAYTIASQENGYVMLEEVTGVLGANVPVFVNAPAGDYEFYSTTAAADVTESGLAGTLYNKNITAEAYILSTVNDVVGLYKAKLTDGAFLNNANKAYYVPVNGNAPAMFSFGRGEGTTGIDNAPLTIDNVVIYDLQGRRVEQMEKGIYIVNGKKVIR